MTHVTVTTPITVILATLDVESVLALTVYVIVPSPTPASPLVIVNQDWSLVAVHASSVITLIV